jgi:hypothetical protein
MTLQDSKDPASGEPLDYNRAAGDGKHRSHRFLASNKIMPGELKLEGAEEQTRLTELWLQGKLDFPEIADIWAAGPVFALDMLAPEEVQPVEEIEVKLVITSTNVGHDFPTGPLDIIQAWVEMFVVDDTGREVLAAALNAIGVETPAINGDGRHEVCLGGHPILITTPFMGGVFGDN